MITILNKQSILNIYCLILLFSSLVHGYIRVRVGAGFEIYIFIILFLAILFLQNNKVVLKEYLPLLLIVLLSFISNILGYLNFFNENLVDSFNSNITFESKMIVDSFRFYVGVMFLFISFWVITSLEILIKTIYIFLLGALSQALYGIMEFFLKLNGSTFLLINEKSIEKEMIVRSYGTFFEPSQYGIFIGATILFYLLFLKLSVSTKYEKSFLVKYSNIVILIFLFALLFSISRAAFIAFFIAIIPYIIMNVYKPKIYISLIIGLMFFFSFDFFSHIETQIFKGFALYESSYENTLLNRLLGIVSIYNVALQKVFEFPYGAGIGSSYFVFGNPGILFKVMYELGIVNSLVILSIVVYIFFVILRMKYYKMELLSLLVFLIIALQNYDSYSHVWILFMLFVLYNVPKFIM